MATFPKVHCATGSLLTATVNANTNVGSNHIVPGAADRTITVVDGWLRATGGNAGGATAVVVEDTAGTDVISATVGALTQNTIARVGDTNVTASAIGTAMAKGAGLRITRTVSDLTTASSIEYCILYIVES